MKRLLSPIIMLIAILALCVSCSKSDSDNDGSRPTGPSTETAKSTETENPDWKPFVGMWYADGMSASNGRGALIHPNIYLLLYSEGKCLHHNLYDNTKGMYDWSYDASTKLLTTTANRGSWIINLVSDDRWSGLSQWSDDAYTARKVVDENLALTILEGKWESVDDKTKTITFGYNNFQYYSGNSYQTYNNFSLTKDASNEKYDLNYGYIEHGILFNFYHNGNYKDVTYDENTDKLILTSKVKDATRDSIVFNKPYSYKNQNIELYLGNGFKGHYRPVYSE